MNVLPNGVLIRDGGSLIEPLWCIAHKKAYLLISNI